jgi:hypothetical protein
MGSKTFEGVRFSVYPNDHLPPHVHGSLSGVTLVVDLLGEDEVRLSKRKHAVSPTNAKKNIVTRILQVAADNMDELNVLWEKTHGKR